MKNHQRLGFVFIHVFLILMTACAPVKTLDVWKDETYKKPLKKTLVIAVAEQGYLRNQFENVLSNKLQARGVEAVPSYKVLPQPGGTLEREAVLAKVRELGVESVLVARAVKESSYVNSQSEAVAYVSTAVYSDDWVGYFSGPVVFSQNEYDTDIYIVETKVFDVDKKRPVWSSLSQVNVDNEANQGAINQFIPKIIKQLEESNLIVR